MILMVQIDIEIVEQLLKKVLTLFFCGRTEITVKLGIMSHQDKSLLDFNNQMTNNQVTLPKELVLLDSI